MSSLVGHTLASFSVVEVIGQGGMGVVYRAVDTRLKRPVALKVLREEFTQDPARKRRFVQEAQSASALNHPGIVTIYEIGSSDGLDFIVMEYIEGESLAALIGRGPLDLTAGLDHAVQVADALSRAHEGGILHRDLKPHNIMITARHEAKIVDFGLAKLLEPSRDEPPDANTVTALDTRPGTLVGTPHYMSPEQAEGKPLDDRSDIFSLGIVLYEMFTGRRPFIGASAPAVVGAILKDEPAPLASRRGDLPAELGRIIAKALEKDREYRYQRMRELLADLKRLRRDLDTRASRHEESTARRAFRFRAIGAGLAVSIAAAALLWFWHPWRPARQVPAIRLVSTFPGSHTAPTFSPDGTAIAFQADGGGVAQIWIKNLSEGEPLQITQGSAPSYRPRWSPNNDQIVFHRSDGIWSVPPPKGTPRRIIDGGSNARWSGDGTRLVFERNDEIWLADASGANQRRVDGVPRVPRFVTDRCPALSPDGARIAYFQSRSNSPLGDVWVVDLSTGKAQAVTRDGLPGGTPVWTPDGRRIIYSSTRRGSSTLWSVPAGGGMPEPVTLGSGEDTDPDISRDGRRLIYTNTRNSFVLKLTDTATGRDQDLMEFRDRKIVYPSFSPAGDRIGFFRQGDEGDSHLFAIDRDGHNLVQVTRTRGEQNIFPRWTGDGGSLYYFQVKPQASLRLIGVDSGRVTEIGPGWAFGVVRFPHLSSSGRLLVYERSEAGSDACLIRDLETGTESRLPSYIAAPRWSRDGRSILGEHAGEIVLYSTEDRMLRKVTTGRRPAWSADESQIYFERAGKLDDGQELWRVSRDGTRESKVVDLRPMVAMDPFFDVSVKDELTWVQFRRGVHELWLMDLGADRAQP